MKTAEQQLEKIQQDLEGMLNDFEGGVSEKDETIVLLRNYIYERAEYAVKMDRQRIGKALNEIFEFNPSPKENT